MADWALHRSLIAISGLNYTRLVLQLHLIETCVEYTKIKQKTKDQHALKALFGMVRSYVRYYLKNIVKFKIINNISNLKFVLKTSLVKSI